MKTLYLAATIFYLCWCSVGAFAACVTPAAAPYRYANPSTVYYTLAPSISNIPAGSGAGAGTSPQSQIANAFTAWNNAGVGVTFLPATSGHPGTLTVQTQVTYNKGDNFAAESTVPDGINSSTTPTSITFYTNNTFEGQGGSGGTVPIYNSAAAGYSSMFLMVTLHEVGHLLGLADLQNDNPPNSNGVAGSTEEQGAGTNLDMYALPSAPTSCDINAVKTYAQQTPPAPGGGGGGDNPNPPPPPSPPPPPPLPICSAGECTVNGCQPGCTGNETWNPQSCICEIAVSPIVIDTDGQGFQLTSLSNGVMFDFFGSGNPMQLSWTAAGSTNGWLALDRNGNGLIDSAKELFGNITDQPPSYDPNGFRALAVFDQPDQGGNDDGVINAQDDIWPRLRVWIDKNHDGISQKDELFTLEDVGVSAIRLGYTLSKQTDQYGNTFRYKGSLVRLRDDDVDRVIYDVFLVRGVNAP